jgi:thiol:disulfide interchange protein
MLRFSSVVFILIASLSLTVGCDSAPSTQPSTASSAAGESLRLVVRGQIHFIQGYSDGYQQAQRLNKPMLVFFTAKWCTFCHQMETEAFSDEQVSSLARQFVCVLVDADQEPEVCQEFRVRGYPTIQFLSTHGVPLNRLMGKRPAQQVISQMQAALLATATRDSHSILR